MFCHSDTLGMRSSLLGADPNNTRTLRRAIRLTGGILLTVSAVTPASSMFIIMPGAINQAGTGILYSLAIAACIGIVMALVYSELASAYPNAGGEYVIVANILGLCPSYIVLVLNAIVMSLIAAVLAIGAGDYFVSILPDVPPKITAIVIIGLATFFGILHIKLNALVTGFFLAVELLCIVYVANLAGTHWVQPFSIFWPPMLSVSGELHSAGLITILFATATVVFAFNGYEQAVYLTEEIIDAKRTIAKIIIGSLVVSLLFESVPTILLLVSSDDILSTVASSSPFQDLIKRLSGDMALKYVSAGITIAVLNACIVTILTTARFVYSTGRHGFWGAWLGNRLSSISDSQGTPWFATLLVGGLGVVACLLVDFNLLLVLTATGLIFVYGILCVCVIVGRSNGTTSGADFQMPFPRLLPSLGIVAFLGIAATNLSDRDIGRPSLAWTFAEIAVALAAYWAMHLKGRDLAIYRNITELSASSVEGPKPKPS
jgi:amino acid transporter